MRRNGLQRMKKDNKTFFTILAGGTGSRLWPLSSVQRPKQLIPFLGNSSLLEQTVARISPLTSSKEDVVVVTHRLYAQIISDELVHQVGAVIAEPYSRNTFPALLNALMFLRNHTDDDPILAILPADHFIPDQGNFVMALATMQDLVAQQPVLAVLGAFPTHPATGYGYIQYDEQSRNNDYKKVLKFHEKPDAQTAQHYLTTGNYLWNMGIVVGRLSTFWQESMRHMPHLVQLFESACDMQTAYEQVPTVSLDVALLEKSDRVVVFSWNYEWYDVGNIQTYVELHKRYNKNAGQQVININSDNTLILSKKKVIACVGVDNICIVETDDALLIVNQADVEQVRSVVENLDHINERS